MVPIWPVSSNRLLIHEPGRGQKHCDCGRGLELLDSPTAESACSGQQPSSDVQIVEGHRSIGHVPPKRYPERGKFPSYAKLECLMGRFRRSHKRGVETDLGCIRRIN